MARPYWKGSISFGLVNVPVALYGATSPKDPKFHLYHDADGGRIHEKRVCERDGAEVPWAHVVKGYELSKTQVVTVTPEELRAADPERDRTVAIEEFVRLEEVDPLRMEKSYWVAPDARAGKAYALLVEALSRAELVAIARVVLSTKQHLCMLRATEGRLVLTTLVWDDEVQAAPEIAKAPTAAKELAMAEQLVKSMTARFEPARFEDTHRKKVEALLARKAKGHAIEAPAAPAQARVVDLARALEQSLAAARGTGSKSGGRARPAARPAARARARPRPAAARRARR